MAFGAGGRMKCLGMAGAATAAAVVHTAATFICDPRVRTAVFRRPILDRMAGDTVQSKQTGMVGWVDMAARANGGQAGKLAGGMTALAGHVRMPTYQSKPCSVVIEIGIFPVGGIMTGRAIGAVLALVFILLLMAGIAVRGRALKNPVSVAGVTGNLLVLTFKLKR